MSKKLNSDTILNELKGGSAFFPSYSQKQEEAEPVQPLVEPVISSPLPIAQKQTEKKKVERQVNKASSLVSYNASMLADEATIELIRKTVKKIGKDVTFIRLTSEEKNQLGDIVYTYKREGVRTSENEIGRIGLNYLLSDYKTNDKTSILARVIEALNA